MVTAWEVCDACGAVVAAVDVHAAWHLAVDPTAPVLDSSLSFPPVLEEPS